MDALTPRVERRPYGRLLGQWNLRAKREPRIFCLATHPLEYVSLKRAGEFLGLREDTFRRRVESGKVPSVVINGRRRVAVRDLYAEQERRERIH